MRFVGEEAAARYHAAWLGSGPGTAGEITLEQWLRAKRGLAGDTALPVCDGCQCGACATMEDGSHKDPCGDASLLLDGNGQILSPRDEPRIVSAAGKRGAGGALLVEISVAVPAHALTQTPVADDDGLSYPEGTTYLSLVPYEHGLTHHYEDLPGAWRIAIEAGAGPLRWPWRASLAQPGLGATWNRANVVLPGKAGSGVVRMAIPRSASGRRVQVTLLRDGVEHETQDVAFP
jgi:hypothetical protein